MTPAEHYAEAEGLLDSAADCGPEQERGERYYLRAAQVHATLATASTPTDHLALQRVRELERIWREGKLTAAGEQMHGELQTALGITTQAAQRQS